MTANVGRLDRLFRVLLGILLVLAPFASDMALFASATATTISVIAGIILLATSAVRFCPLYRILGIQTCKV